MKKFVVLFTLLSITGVLSEGFTAEYGKYSNKADNGDKVLKLAEEHVDVSYKYLMRSAYFGNYMQNRDGFKKFFRELSDKAWNDAIDLIKYNNKRGYHTEVLNFKHDNIWKPTDKLSKDDTMAMESALHVQKNIAQETHNIINHSNVDAELVSYLEEHFLHQHADKVREIAGHVNDLKKLESDLATKSLAITLFDDYLHSL